jgi:hypothetical protein
MGVGFPGYFFECPFIIAVSRPSRKIGLRIG